MADIIVFNSTCQGFSHIKSGKPCQDYSLSYRSDDGNTQIAVVCDGHGSDTYVRSDVGSRLAAEITLSSLQTFVKEVSPWLFLDKKGAVTARPDQSMTIRPKTLKREEDLTETDLMRMKQEEDFYKAVEGIGEQDKVFTHLFASIYSQWLDAIQKDAEEKPFNDYEKGCLGKNKLVKAYGSTLMAFVRTPLYWFAFHVGDGKLMACNHRLQWFEPVPWDYKCFLNLTTSLCDSNPVPEFRYAFSGQGDFPIAVILGSDGLDDSWGNFERLANFYSQTLCIFQEEGHEEAEKELADYLPKLSEKASRDDMSMAGIIDMDALEQGCNIYKKQREITLAEAERQKRQGEVDKMDDSIKSAQAELAKAIEAADTQAKASRDLWAQGKTSLEKTDEEHTPANKAEEKDSVPTETMTLDELAQSSIADYEQEKEQFMRDFLGNNKE